MEESDGKREARAARLMQRAVDIALLSAVKEEEQVIGDKEKQFFTRLTRFLHNGRSVIVRFPRDCFVTFRARSGETYASIMLDRTNPLHKEWLVTYEAFVDHLRTIAKTNFDLSCVSGYKDERKVFVNNVVVRFPSGLGFRYMQYEYAFRRYDYKHTMVLSKHYEPISGEHGIFTEDLLVEFVGATTSKAELCKLVARVLYTRSQ